MNHKSQSGIPTTDDEAVILLLGEQPTVGRQAMYGIYKIKRVQGLDVLDAYMATLNRVIALCDKKV